jgi:hypothetical protein
MSVMVPQISKKESILSEKVIAWYYYEILKIITAFRIVVNSVGVKRKCTMRSIYFNSFD